MTDHRPAARSALRGLIQLLTDHQPHRQPRDFIGEAMRFPYRETSQRGDCPDWLDHVGPPVEWQRQLDAAALREADQ